MKKPAISLVVITGILVSCLSGHPAAQDETRDRIAKATNTLTGQAGAAVTMKGIVDALSELLDVSAVLTPDNQYKKDIHYRIGVAKDLMRDGSIFDDKARQYLSFAYRMMTNGKKFEPPKELDEFVTPAEHQEKALKYIKGLVTATFESLTEGDNQEAARLLLEIVLMTMTPVAG